LGSKNIKTILFDFDGTLRHSIPLGGDVFSDYVSSLGLPLTDDDRLRAARWEHYYFASSPEIEVDRELVVDGDESEFWKNFGRRRLVALGLHPSLAAELAPQVSAHMQETYNPEVWMPEELNDLLPELRGSGYTLGIVSNRSEPYHDTVEEMNLQDYFSFVLAAGEVGSWKPDPKIFHHAARLAKSKPEETVYIGDNYYADVIGARRAGLHPVLYDRRGLFSDTGCPIMASFDRFPEILEGM
jgi:HAD superfamily hydrolase (TIGR01549 family)